MLRFQERLRKEKNRMDTRIYITHVITKEDKENIVVKVNIPAIHQYDVITYDVKNGSDFYVKFADKDGTLILSVAGEARHNWREYILPGLEFKLKSVLVGEYDTEVPTLENRVRKLQMKDGMKASAKFIGKNGSMGFQNGIIYPFTLTLGVQGILLSSPAKGTQPVIYSNVLTFLNNWANVIGG